MVKTGARQNVFSAAGVHAESDALRYRDRVELDESTAERWAQLALDCVNREFPNKVAHAMNSEADVEPPRKLTPVFYGCYDWHSAVHGHWVLARLTRRFPDSPFALQAKHVFDGSFSPDKIEQEVGYMTEEGREAFERPYGLAWFLQLAAEFSEWPAVEARRWSDALRPLETTVVERLSSWLPKLGRPIRTGEHNNTAFALGLMLDYAHAVGNAEFGGVVSARARHYYYGDRACPLAYEPSGEDFLSPCLAEADVMRRVLAKDEFGEWFSAFLPAVDLAPTCPADITDGKLGHLIGLNLSRAWMLEGIVSKLRESDKRREELLSLRNELAAAGLAGIRSELYQNAHWLGTFAVYLLTRRGIE